MDGPHGESDEGVNEKVAQPVFLHSRQHLRQSDGQGNDGQKQIPDQQSMSKCLTPVMLPVVNADDLHRVDGAKEGGCPKCVEEDSHSRGWLGYLNRRGCAFSLGICHDFHMSKPSSEVIPMEPYSGWKSLLGMDSESWELYGAYTVAQALEDIGRDQAADIAAKAEDFLEHP